MPILGILASAITGNLVTNSYESIATVTVGSGGSSTVSFTSIPSTYTHLQVRIIARSTYAGDSDYMTLTAPSAGTWYHQLYGNGSSAGAIGSNYVKLITLMPGATSTASVFGTAIVDILDYTNTNKTKTMRSLNGYDANGSGRLGLYSANIDTTTAISTITFASDNSANFAQYSSFALYGIKGA
jgi:hypothetical protein